jgi:hypothetical protein
MAESGRDPSALRKFLALVDLGGAWEEKAPQLRNLWLDASTALAETKPQPATPLAAVVPPAVVPPAVYLTSWREILITLGMHDDREDKQKVSRLNNTRNGPIKIPGQGKQPFVEKVPLADWWNNLAVEFQTENRQRDAQATVSAQHDYGWGGVVAPDINGGVKKRRWDQKP